MGTTVDWPASFFPTSCRVRHGSGHTEFFQFLKWAIFSHLWAFIYIVLSPWMADLSDLGFTVNSSGKAYYLNL